jgi:tetratricopeptide (TPR) repeat protein
MMRLIIILLSVLLVFGSGQPVMAQSQPPNFNQQELQQLNDLAQKALQATNNGDFATAEIYWTQIIEQFPDNPAALSNRGNARVSQNKLADAIADYNKAAELAPNATDPYLNRGTAFEGLGKWKEAIADYNHVLELDPKDAMAYNNRGNAEAGLENGRMRSPTIANPQTWLQILLLPVLTTPSLCMKLVKLKTQFAKCEISSVNIPTLQICGLRSLLLIGSKENKAKQRVTGLQPLDLMGVTKT